MAGRRVTPPTDAVLLEIRDLLRRLVAAAERGPVQRPKAPPITPAQAHEIAAKAMRRQTRTRKR